ncbi:MAG: hypothetical protein ACP5OP_04835 [Leptospirillia bacterium]
MSRYSLVFLAGLITALVLSFEGETLAAAQGMSGAMGAPSPSATAPSPTVTSGSLPGSGFALEGFAGGDTSLSGSYSTTGGQTVPYNFGSAPLWGIRLGKMVASRLFLYLTFQQTYFSQNTHTLVGFGGNYYLPGTERLPVLPYLNATFGASYNTYTGTDAQAGYGWMLGAGALYPVTPSIGVFVEADAYYETAPAGINTSIGSPPGNISRVSDTWSIPVMVGVRYAF